jgi:nicotinate-nucleotide adenylyltransferase
MVKTSSFFPGDGTWRVGILGGTFNPPHLGHLRLAEEVAWVHGLDQIMFIPCHIPPHKYSTDIASAEDRLRMTNLACADNPLFRVSDMEIVAEGPSYTVKTLAIFSDKPGQDIFFILGTDSLREIHTWRDHPKLFALSHFIVVTRPGIDFAASWTEVPDSVRKQFQDCGEYLLHSSSHRLIPSQVKGLDVSSTRIRELVRNRQSIRYLLPEAVRSYILEKGLYRN